MFLINCNLSPQKNTSVLQACTVLSLIVITKFLSSSSPWTSALPLLPPSPFFLRSKLEDLRHRPHFSSNLVGSKVASWAEEASRWLRAQGGTLQRPFRFLTPPLPWVPAWGGSGSGNLPELSGMASRLPMNRPLLRSHMAPAMGSLSLGSDLRKINCGRAEEGKPHSLRWVHGNESIHEPNGFNVMRMRQYLKRYMLISLNI